MTQLARRRGSNWLWIAIAVSLVVSLTPWAAFLLYPFKLFTTWVHECGHAVATLLVGGRVTSITIQPDTSGLTHSLVPAGRLGGGIVTSAGYLGAAAVGCLLVAATRVERWAPIILRSLAICLFVTLVFWMRNVFGIVVVLAWGVTLMALSRKGVVHAARFFLGLLAVQVALDSVYDIRVLFLIDRGPSDAVTMQHLFLLPAWLWASIWMLMSVAMLGATLWATRDR
jgi:hypothetical protein